jgi:hypothetical protein
MRVTALVLLLATLWSPAARAQPLRVSADGRSFTDGTGAPFFWLGNTQWAIFRGFTMPEAEAIVDDIAGKGFTVMATMVVGGPDANKPNVEGQLPWLDGNPATPNEAYFKRVDAIVSYAARKGLFVRLGLLHNSQLEAMAGGRGAAYAKWVATRYRDAPNVFWSLHGNVDNPAIIAMVRAMAAAIREADGGRHLISQKPDPAPKSSGIIQAEPWLAFTQSQTWKHIDLIYPMVTADRARTPPKPTVMDEGAYEGGTEYGFPVTPLLVRRQAYYTYLAGGVHTYGHNDAWRVLPTWRAALDAPGAAQLGILKKTLVALPEWWRLMPDAALLAAGGKTTGDVLVLGARHEAGAWALVYSAAKATFSVDLSRLASAPVEARWIDPRSGQAQPAGRLRNTGVRRFATPAGWEDALLQLTARRSGPR